MEKIKLDGAACQGPKDAKVTIVEYSDFQCPFCAKGYTTLEQQVLKEYGDKVKFCFKDFPLAFHPWAEPAAIAAECVTRAEGRGVLEGLRRLLPEPEGREPHQREGQGVGASRGAEIDKAKFDDCFDNKKTQAGVKADRPRGGRSASRARRRS